MFSSLLPSVSTSMGFAQNGPSKPSNRFSVRVFKTGTAAGQFLYPLSTKSDPGYRGSTPQPPPREQQNSKWYTPTSYASYDQQPRATANFAIYPSAMGDTFIYEQSTCSKSDLFSNSEFDSSSTATPSPTSTFSPSSESTLMLQNASALGRSLDNQRVNRAPTPAPYSVYNHGAPALQSVQLSRVGSTSHHVYEPPAVSMEAHRARVASLPGRSTTPFRAPMPPTAPSTAMARVPSAGGFIQIPEYAASTLSEMEVDQRDRQAKLNADFNAAASASYFSAIPGSSNDINKRLVSITPQVSPSSGRDYSTRGAPSTQPLHPNLHFPVRASEPDFVQPPFYPPGSKNPTISDSPPRVERISSRLPQEYQSHSRTPSPQHLALPTSDTRSRENGYRPDSSRTSSYRASPPKNVSDPFEGISIPSSRSMHATYGTSVQDTSTHEHRQDRGSLAESSGRRSSVVGPRPDITGLRPSPEYRQVDTPPSRAGSDSSSSTLRDHNSRDRDPSRHDFPGAEMRRDTRTPAPRDSEDYRPAPPSRRDSYAPGAQAPRSQNESRTQPQTVKEVYKQGPLSSSPTQVRLSPVEPPFLKHGVPLPLPSDNERPQERPRTRSSSFSASVRPHLLIQTAPLELRQAEYEKLPRNSDMSSRRMPRAEPERRSDPHVPSSQTYYSQVPPIPASAKYAAATDHSRTSPTARPAMPEPQRRNSDGDQCPPVRPQLSGRNSAPLLRCVRWNEDLICPSPIFPSQRRKGWFNRRGDQLWTNDGAYKAAPAGQEFPPELDEYPEQGLGWMNEEGVRIDLTHRLIPKPPLRSALKQSKA